MKSESTKLLIIGSSQGCYGGIEAFMIAIAEAALRWPEFEVKLCFKIVKGAQLENDLKRLAENICPDVHYIRRGSIDLFKLVAWSDVIHAQNTPPDIIFAARLTGKKVFLTVHNRRMPNWSLHNLIWGVSIKFAHRRWFNSNFVWGTWEPNKKSSKSDCVPTVCRLPDAWCSPEKRKGFLFVGRWIKNKGIEEILKAYALNNFDHNKWSLTILGDGPIKPTVLFLINELGLENVSMPGFVDEEVKAKYLSSTRWLLAPARTLEDLGLTPIEARSVGVPSIVTRDGGLPESGGEAALIAEPGNIDDLANCMRIAAAMSETEYQERGFLAKKSLSEFLKPIDFYREMYLS